MLHVTCNLSPVTCHLSPVACHLLPNSNANSHRYSPSPLSHKNKLPSPQCQQENLVKQGKVCWHSVLDWGLGPRLVTRTAAAKNEASWWFLILHDASWPCVDASCFFLTFPDSSWDFLTVTGAYWQFMVCCSGKNVLVLAAALHWCTWTVLFICGCCCPAPSFRTVNPSFLMVVVTSPGTSLL